MQETKRLIVFDDDEDLLSIFRFFFEEQGWQVHTFDHCDDVIREVQHIRPHLILMDNWIPSIGGIAATQLLKSNADLKEIPIIYVSANNELPELCKKAGADAYIPKPFDLDVLWETAVKLA